MILWYIAGLIGMLILSLINNELALKNGFKILSVGILGPIALILALVLVAFSFIEPYIPEQKYDPGLDDD